MNSQLPIEVTHRYFLTAGETDAEGLMPMTLIFERCIEVATEHANVLGIGYARLIERGIGWVLTRLTVEMERYPGINEEYAFTTWIESYNRLYSNRCFLITDGEGRTIGHARSMWVAMDMTTRSAADLSQFGVESFPVSERTCPVAQQRKMPDLPEVTRSSTYAFRYSDIDFNRHVNTVMYLRLILNQWSLQHYDEQQISRLAIAFHKECYYGEEVDIKVCDRPDGAMCEIAHQGQRCIITDIKWQPRGEKQE